jgi:starch synthase
MFVMASRYEPCGLNQLYSLRYGAVPIVHRTGGLADTINDANPQTLADATANGFDFTIYDVDHLEQAMNRACQVYGHDRPHWEQLVTTGMGQDWSWRHSAQRYVELYQMLVDQKRP